MGIKKTIVQGRILDGMSKGETKSELESRKGRKPKKVVACLKATLIPINGENVKSQKEPT